MADYAGIILSIIGVGPRNMHACKIIRSHDFAYPKNNIIIIMIAQGQLHIIESRVERIVKSNYFENNSETSYIS